MEMMMKHYTISAIRNIKKFSLNALINCLLQIFCLSTLIILVLHLFKGSIPGNYQVIILMLMLVLVLIAGFNFYNLSTLQIFKRKEELGLRMMLGAGIKDLAILIIVESMLRMVLATVLSMVFADLFIPFLNRFTYADISMKYDFTWHLIPILLVLNGIIGAFAWINLKINRNKISTGFQ